MINKQSIQKILETHLVNLFDKKGIIIDGYPRDIKQVTDFEEKVCVFVCVFINIRERRKPTSYFSPSYLNNNIFIY